MASAGNASTSLVEQQATLLAGFVDTFIGMATLPANSSHQLANGVGLIGSAINGAMGSGRGISDSTIDSFLGVVDAVAGTIGASDGGCVPCLVAGPVGVVKKWSLRKLVW